MAIKIRRLQATIMLEFADLAQLAEQLICNQQVVGSTPIVGSKYFKYINKF